MREKIEKIIFGKQRSLGEPTHVEEIGVTADDYDELYDKLVEDNLLNNNGHILRPASFTYPASNVRIRVSENGHINYSNGDVEEF